MRTVSGFVPVHRIQAVLGLTAAAARARYGRLTQRERRVAGMIAAGIPSRQIAAEFNISGKTVDIHRMRIKNKLGADTIAQIANVVNLARLAGAADGADAPG